MYNINNIYECIFIKRNNRFVATVLLDGNEIDVHVKNTGRCKELLIPGSKAYLVKSENSKRKYAYDLVSIYKGDELVNFDSQLPNEVVANYISEGRLFSNVQTVKREVTYNKSRFDVYVERKMENDEIEKLFVEVKGVTLFENKHAKFPDAPTERGTKHIYELVDSIADGYRACIFFLVQTENVTSFSANDVMDPKFAAALKYAKEMGVEVYCFNSKVTKNEVIINERVNIVI